MLDAKTSLSAPMPIIFAHRHAGTAVLYARATAARARGSLLHIAAAFLQAFAIIHIARMIDDSSQAMAFCRHGNHPPRTDGLIDR